MRYLTDSYRRRVAEAILTGLAVVLAFVATAVGRGQAGPYFVGGCLFVGVSELIYSGNMLLGQTIFRSLERSTFHRYGNAAGALFFGGFGVVVIGVGLTRLLVG